MKFLHLADLHFGKSLHNLPLIEADQPYWVGQLLDYLDDRRPDAVVIAGDVYDRGVPSKEAQSLLSDFLEGIAAKEIPVLLIAGNHDGGERLEFLRGLLSRQSIHIAGVPQREMTHVTLQDQHGAVNFWLMPYVFPAAVRQVLGVSEQEIPDYDTAVRALLAEQDIDFTQRNVLIAHQNVLFGGMEPERSGSESSVGGVGGIGTGAFDGFDYVALGHIHGAQRVGADHIRYAGAPLCYHFSEANQSKGALLVTLGEKGSPIQAEQTRLKPLHRVRPTMVGSLEEIIAAETASTATGEYIRVELTDRQPPLHAREQLDSLFRSHGCTLLEVVRRPAARTVESTSLSPQDREQLTTEQLFEEFCVRYREGQGLDEPERRLVTFAVHQLSTTEQEPADRAKALADLALTLEVNP